MIGFSLILACTIDGGIGIDNKIPWDIKEDLKLFQEITTKIDNNYNSFKKNAIIMGRKTWESLPYKPLKNRLNIIISTKPNKINTYNNCNIAIFNNLDYALQYCYNDISIDNVFVIGGKSLYDLCLFNPYYSKYLTYIHLSVVPKKYTCDTYIDFKKIIKLYKKYNINDIIFHKEFIYIKLINNRHYY
jgi:dihydrofolate reductase